jgi:hypothetical protein
MKTLVLVLGATRPPFPALIRAQKRTWAARDLEGVDVMFYFGGGSGVERRGRELYIAAPDDYWSIGKKTIACFEHVLGECDFDLVFRTNCSSYVDLPNLRDWVREHARSSRFYAGVIGSIDGPGVPYEGLAVRLAHEGRLEELAATGPGASFNWSFASGAGYFLSRDLVEWVVAHRSEWNHHLPDDMALGRLLVGCDVAPEPAPRVILGNAWHPRKIDTSHFLFRCKTESSLRRGDIDLMHKVDAAFTAARGEAPSPWYTPSRRLKLALHRVPGAARPMLRRLTSPRTG